MALYREPRGRRTGGAAGKDQQPQLPNNDANTRPGARANCNSGEPIQLAELTGAAPAGRVVEQRDQSTAKHEPRHSEEPPWLSWFISGSLFGAAIGLVVGAVGGWRIAAGWVEGGVLAFLLRSIGAVIGGVIGAPFGLFIGQIVGVLLGEIFGLISLVFLLPLLLFRRGRKARQDTSPGKGS
jgi:hypothetical protein